MPPPFWRAPAVADVLADLFPDSHPAARPALENASPAPSADTPRRLPALPVRAAQRGVFASCFVLPFLSAEEPTPCIAWSNRSQTRASRSPSSPCRRTRWPASQELRICGRKPSRRSRHAGSFDGRSGRTPRALDGARPPSITAVWAGRVNLPRVAPAGPLAYHLKSICSRAKSGKCSWFCRGVATLVYAKPTEIVVITRLDTYVSESLHEDPLVPGQTAPHL